jgi:hypothetical protein
MKPSLKSQSGQAIIESVLILTILFGFTFMAAQYFKNEEFLKRLITGPFVNLSGLLQNGVWAPPGVGAASHPSHHFRHIVITGEPSR